MSDRNPLKRSFTDVTDNNPSNSSDKGVDDHVDDKTAPQEPASIKKPKEDFVPRWFVHVSLFLFLWVLLLMWVLFVMHYMLKSLWLFLLLSAGISPRFLRWLRRGTP